MWFAGFPSLVSPLKNPGTSLTVGHTTIAMSFVLMGTRRFSPPSSFKL
jgi:hypothetical protein